MKSTVEEIRRRFDADVERFSNLQTGQSAAVDSPLAMDLAAQAAAAVTPGARDLLDIGCGAGNYTLKLLEYLPKLHVTLIDLSVREAKAASVTTLQGDIRAIPLPTGGFDVIVAAAVLHHLRTDDEWRQVFAALYRALRPGGSVWIFDMVEGAIAAIDKLMRSRYGEYLTKLNGEAYRDRVLAYVEKEDTPRSLVFQLDLLREAGFIEVEVLHKNVCFAAFGAVKR
jgi:tRNA (cmo5U34)-methyltransferase